MKTNRYAKRGPVIMPVEPPYEVLRAMAGNPVILAASDEFANRGIYETLRQALVKCAKERRK